MLTFCSWDNIYNRELQNHAEDDDDEGTLWFSESNAEEAILQQLASLCSVGHLRRRSEDDEDPPKAASRFLDLGTGNGHMLFRLRAPDEEDLTWDGELVGIDYSEASVSLARRIEVQKFNNGAEDSTSMRFEHWDLLREQPGNWLSDGFDAVLDKGTFDAISLMQHDGGPDHPCQVYREKVVSLIKPGGFLLVTSCNWTKQELLQWLAPPNGDLVYFDEADYPTFSFGGQTGQTIVTIVFRKNAS